VTIEISTLRSHRLKLAVAASIGSKVATVVLQVLVMPLAVRALGPERFGVYVMLTASLNWIWSAGIGIGPSLTVAIARAVADGDSDREARSFSSAFFAILAICVLILTATGAVGLRYSPETVLGAQYAVYRSDIGPGLFVLVACLVNVLLLGVVEGAQAGYQEQYIINLFTMLGNILGTVSLFVFGMRQPSIINLILCLYIVAYLPRALNAFILIGSRSQLRPRVRHFDIGIVKMLLGTGAAFSLVQLGMFLKQECGILLVGRLLGPGTVVTMQLQPLLPALTDAVARGDLDWIRRVCSKALSLTMLYAISVGVTLAILGAPIIRIWYGPQVMPGVHLQVAIGVSFVLQAWELYHLLILFGLGRVWPPTIAFIIQNAVMLLLCTPLIRCCGSVGAAYSLCLTVLLIDAWLLPLMLRGELERRTVGWRTI
jgi:O-antigen/teichoic acid export membrane protein